MKRAQETWRPTAKDVAPHAGAWIETIVTLLSRSKRRVAPHAGAWIETACQAGRPPRGRRRPPRGGVD